MKLKKKYKLKKTFKEYRKHIGLPFQEILKNLKINKNKKSIQKFYSNRSIKNINKVKLFPNVKTTLNGLNKKFSTAVVTSKDLKRTKILLNKFNLKFNVISCPNNKLKGKPYPDQLNFVMKKLKFKPSNTVYVADTYFDYLAARNAKITFIHAKYGFQKKISNVKVKINSFKEIKKKLL